MNQLISKADLLIHNNRPGVAERLNFDYKNLIEFVEYRPGHDYRYAIDSTKIKNELKWEPMYTFEKGIKKTIQWYLANESWWRKIQNENYNQERLGLKK